MIRLQQSGRALGSDVSLTLVVRDEAAGLPLFKALWTQINSFEERFSRFKANSELSGLNAAAGQAVKISPQMYDLLAQCQKLAKQTGGLFNPLVLPALQQAGYVGSWPTPSQSQPKLNYSLRKVAEFDELRFDSQTAKLPADTALDFGGIGKGYLLDQLSVFLDKAKVKGYWLSLGGDIICKGADHQAQPWRIGLASASVDHALAGSVINKEGNKLAVATSGVIKRQGPGWHHIIDPRTNQPAKTDVLTASVTSQQAITADVFAKCLVIDKQLANNLLKDDIITAYLIQTSQNDTIKTIKAGAIL